MRVAGCSVDSLEVQRAFAGKLGLRFPLIADLDAKVARAFGALRDDRPVAQRSTVLLGSDQRVLRAYPAAQARGHAEQVVQDARLLLA